MRIAIISWGSLIWCPGCLRITAGWRADGPLLPIEFARISDDGRLTLVILPGSEDVRTYWAPSGYDVLEMARENLRDREKARELDNIRCIRRDECADDSRFEIDTSIRRWLTQRDDLDAAVWTALGSNWKKRRGYGFSPQDAVSYMLELEENRHEASATFDVQRNTSETHRSRFRRT